MSEHIHRVAMITPEARRDEADKLVEPLGWGSGCFSVPLYADGKITHYGLSASATAGFVAGLEADTMDGLLIAIDDADADPVAQFDHLCAELGVSREGPEPYE